MPPALPTVMAGLVPAIHVFGLTHQRKGPLTPPSPRTRGEGAASVALCGFDKASAGGEEQRNDREKP